MHRGNVLVVLGDEFGLRGRALLLGGEGGLEGREVGDGVEAPQKVRVVEPRSGIHPPQLDALGLCVVVDGDTPGVARGGGLRGDPKGRIVLSRSYHLESYERSIH